MQRRPIRQLQPLTRTDRTEDQATVPGHHVPVSLTQPQPAGPESAHETQSTTTPNVSHHEEGHDQGTTSGLTTSAPLSIHTTAESSPASGRVTHGPLNGSSNPHHLSDSRHAFLTRLIGLSDQLQTESHELAELRDLPNQWSKDTGMRQLPAWNRNKEKVQQVITTILQELQEAAREIEEMNKNQRRIVSSSTTLSEPWDVSSSSVWWLPWKIWQGIFWSIKLHSLIELLKPSLAWFKQQVDHAHTYLADTTESAWSTLLPDPDREKTLAKLACSIIEVVLAAPDLDDSTHTTLRKLSCIDRAMEEFIWMKKVNSRRPLFPFVPAIYTVILKALVNTDDQTGRYAPTTQSKHSSSGSSRTHAKLVPAHRPLSTTTSRPLTTEELDRARSFFDSIPPSSCDVVTFTVMATAYQSSNRSFDSDDIYRLMRSRGMQLDAVANNQQIQALIEPIRQCRDKRKKEDLYEQARQLYNTALTNPILMDSLTCSIMIKLERTYDSFSIRPIVEVIESAREAEQHPDVAVKDESGVSHRPVFVNAAAIGQLHAFIAAHSQEEALEWVDLADREWEWLVEAEKQAKSDSKHRYSDRYLQERWKQLRINDLALNSRNKLLLRCGRHRVLNASIDTRQHMTGAKRLTPSQLVVLLNGFAADDDYDGHRVPLSDYSTKVDGVVRSYHLGGGRLDAYIVSAWLGCYVKRMDLEHGNTIWQAMIDDGEKPTGTTYARMIELLLRCQAESQGKEEQQQHQQRIRQLINEMRGEANNNKSDDSSTSSTSSLSSSSSSKVSFSDRDLEGLIKCTHRMHLWDWVTEFKEIQSALGYQYTSKKVKEREQVRSPNRYPGPQTRNDNYHWRKE